MAGLTNACSELSCVLKGADIIPKRGVTHGDGARTFHLPGELIHLLDFKWLAIGESDDFLNVAAEIADFI